jgi:hypothetical protein
MVWCSFKKSTGTNLPLPLLHEAERWVHNHRETAGFKSAETNFCSVLEIILTYGVDGVESGSQSNRESSL